MMSGEGMNLDKGWLDEASDEVFMMRYNHILDGCTCTFGWHAEDSSFSIRYVPGCPLHGKEKSDGGQR